MRRTARSSSSWRWAKASGSTTSAWPSPSARRSARSSERSKRRTHANPFPCSGKHSLLGGEIPFGEERSPSGRRHPLRGGEIRFGEETVPSGRRQSLRGGDSPLGEE